MKCAFPLLLVAIGFLLSSVALPAQTGGLAGIVLDEHGLPLAGAAVQIPGGPGRVTDDRGRFLLQPLPPQRWTLEVRFLGYDLWRREMGPELPDILEIHLVPQAYALQTLELTGTWSGPSAPFPSEQIRREDLDRLHQGQDIPWLLRFTPGVVATSDAGTGIGYTGLRIRGSDPTRINVTLNGVPVNDSESQAVFWVNMPDLVASTDHIEIVRGVGGSTNGAGAFGATVGLQSLTYRDQAYGEIGGGMGSFGTRRIRAAFGTGEIGNGWALDGRWSRIASEGYIDRATADLESLYGSLTWKGGRSLFRLLAFTGNERTYQAWWGTPQSRLENDEEGMLAHAARNGFTPAQTTNLLTSGRSYNYYTYENEVDQYTQTHVQIHGAHALSRQWRANATLHYTRGAGYFEQFREQDDIRSYGLEPVVVGMDTLTHSDIVRRRWLDNHFGGAIANLRYESEIMDIHFGGAWNRYWGDHFGRVIWASAIPGLTPGFRYYDGDAVKTDGNVFGKVVWRPVAPWEFFGDIQYRHIRYRTSGTESELQPYDVDVALDFFNPKAGINWHLSGSTSIFGSVAVGHREPLRRDYVDAPEGKMPLPERLVDYEVGLRWKGQGWQSAVTAYYMHYRDQLIPTGALNDVGASLLVNVPDSWRTGFEWVAGAGLPGGWQFDFSLAMSTSRIREFEETLYDYTDGFDIIRVSHRNVEIAFSPKVVYNHQLRWNPWRGWSLAWMSQYVASQFLDNTADPSRQLPAWWVQDLALGWEGHVPGLGMASVRLQVNNLLHHQYSSNGYTYSYRYESLVTENFFYPQAGRHWMAGFSVRF